MDRLGNRESLEIDLGNLVHVKSSISYHLGKMTN